MGLGKTISAIALLTALYTTHWETYDTQIQQNDKMGPTLIVCPATVIDQWVSELKVRTATLPQNLSVSTFTGAPSEKNKRKLIQDAFNHSGIIITSYEFLRVEQRLFQKRAWYYIILDEAQKIKNSQSQIHKAVTNMQSHYRLILTGTPM